ncbi:hypothetical protein A8924_1568 [Saccharopolyspora erythraea NRRL 2338]|nr:hypothetical protein [Saccharopolyspora erythraea]PFG94297.1 hypothetical protein A8924_1568 [Saccharopolyspora erythraea NRRL 2338]QRK91067.1 hypothetical protein JQX30_06390 [Saccharopolyspora erythraea]
MNNHGSYGGQPYRGQVPGGYGNPAVPPQTQAWAPAHGNGFGQPMAGPPQQPDPPPKRKLGRRIAIAVAMGAVIGLGGGYGILALTSNGSEQAAPESAPPAPRLDLLADSVERAPMPTYEGQHIVDACALLQPGQVEQLGIPVSHPADIYHFYIDPEIADGPRAVHGTGDAPSSCNFFVHGREGGTPNISLDFLAVPFNKQTSVEVYGSRPEEKRTLGEFFIYTQDVDEDLIAKIPFSNGTMIEVRGSDLLDEYNGRPKRQVFDEIVNTAISNFNAGRSGVQEFRYKQPYGEVEGACDLFSGKAFELATGQRDSGWVEEKVPAYEQQVLNSSVGRYTYVEQSFLRRSPQNIDDPYNQGSEELKVRTYENERIAGAHSDLCTPGGASQVYETGVQIGDGRSCISVYDGSPSIYFRSGRTGFELYGSQGTDPMAFRDRYVPVAQQLLQDMQR